MLICINLNGCGGRPWQDPLAEDASTSIKNQLDVLAALDKQCQKTVEADLTVFYSSVFSKKALKGYFLFSPPESYKFVVTNPLGQTAWAIAGNRNSYQVLEPLRNRYTAGNLDSFGVRNNIPRYFLQGDWSGWLTGRFHYKSDKITDIRSDSQNRGVWITMDRDILSGYTSHLLFDLENHLILERIITGRAGEEIANIRYGETLTTGDCTQAKTIILSGLDLGIKIRMELENIMLLDEISSYTLPVPPGYSQKYLP